MTVLSIITIISAIVTLVAGLFAILKHRYKWLGIVFVVTTSLLALALAWSHLNIIKKEKEIAKISEPLRKIELFNKRYRAADVDFMSNGELKGLVISGMQILEKFRENFPETYENAKRMFYEEHQIFKNKEFFEERDALEDAGDAMMSMMRNLYIVEMPNKTIQRTR